MRERKSAHFPTPPPRENPTQWPELPFYERPPGQCCGSCANLVRLRMDEKDLQGQYVCKWGPAFVTSMVTQTGQVAGMAQNFCPQTPQAWCFQWVPRQSAQSADPVPPLEKPVIAS